MAGVTFNIKLEDSGVMNQSINRSDGHRGFGEHLISAGKRLIGGQCQTLPFVALVRSKSVTGFSEHSPLSQPKKSGTFT